MTAFDILKTPDGGYIVDRSPSIIRGRPRRSLAASKALRLAASCSGFLRRSSPFRKSRSNAYIAARSVRRGSDAAFLARYALQVIELSFTFIPNFGLIHRETTAIAKIAEDSLVQLQVGALPIRLAADRTKQVLLITSRTTRRWIIPKGWPMKGIKDYKAAEREAFEEAGVLGQASKAPLGTYQYWKRGSSAFQLCEVTVYPMFVEQQVSKWREKGQRVTQWFTVEEAAFLVEEPSLKLIIEALSINADGVR